MGGRHKRLREKKVGFVTSPDSTWEERQTISSFFTHDNIKKSRVGFDQTIRKSACERSVVISRSRLSAYRAKRMGTNTSSFTYHQFIIKIITTKNHKKKKTSYQ